MFTIRNFEAKTISWWYDQLENIDFVPSYQRKGRLWSDKDKSYLIDSIFNGFDVPKIYIADFTFFNSLLNEKKKLYAVIDGKQRFEAIFSFYSGELKLDKDFVFVENPAIKLGGLTFPEIKTKYSKIASKFENFNLSVMSVITDDEAMINELFIRMNKSKPLTGAELRNAMSGAIPKITRQIIEHLFFQNKVRFNTARGQDNNVATKLLLIEFRGKFVDTKKIHLDKLVNESIIASENFNIQPAYDMILKNLNLMNGIFDDKDSLLNSSGIIPVYYWFVRNNIKEADIVTIKNFFNYFDSQRKLTREGKIVDSIYIVFDKLAKSLNDQGSLTGCYSILIDKWTDYKKNILLK
jgi:hypothetical protein